MPLSPRFCLGRAALGLAFAALGACSDPDELAYDIEIVGPADTFVGATRVALFAQNSEIASAPVSGEGRFTLEKSGVDPLDLNAAAFSVKAFDAGGALVAYGQTPSVEIFPAARALRVFVQKPATLGLSKNLPAPLVDHVAMLAQAQPVGNLTQVVAVPVFGLGTAAGKPGVPTNALYAYNPLVHEAKALEVPQLTARTEALGFASNDGDSFFFGGYTAGAMGEPVASSLLEVLVLGRGNFTELDVPGQVLRFSGEASTARAASAVELANNKRWLIGGKDAAGMPTGTVASVENAGDRFTITGGTAMNVARRGHTATTDPLQVMIREGMGTRDESAGRILVYGGQGTGAAVAEILEPRAQKWTTVPNAGPPRYDHQAILLPTKTELGGSQILIVGGRNEAGEPLADSLICVPIELMCVDAPEPIPPGSPARICTALPPRCTAAPLKLAQPRAEFVMFRRENDLVVMGGFGPGGVPVDTAEIFDTKTAELMPVKTIKAVPRARGSVFLLPNLSAVILGGVVPGAAGGPPTGVLEVEIYQPRRTQ